MVPDNLLSPLFSVSANDVTLISLWKWKPSEENITRIHHSYHTLCIWASILYLPSCCHEPLVPLTKPVTQLVLQIPSPSHLLRRMRNTSSSSLFSCIISFYSCTEFFLIRLLTWYSFSHLTKAKLSFSLTSPLIHFPNFSPSLCWKVLLWFSPISLLQFTLKLIPVIFLPPWLLQNCSYSAHKWFPHCSVQWLLLRSSNLVFTLDKVELSLLLDILSSLIF